MSDRIADLQRQLAAERQRATELEGKLADEHGMVVYYQSQVRGANEELAIERQRANDAVAAGVRLLERAEEAERQREYFRVVSETQMDLRDEANAIVAKERAAITRLRSAAEAMADAVRLQNIETCQCFRCKATRDALAAWEKARRG